MQLNKMDGSFEKSLKLTNISLFLSGVTIYPLNNFLLSVLKFIFFFNLIWLYFDVFGEFLWLLDGIQKNKSFSELSLVAPLTTICFLSSAKIIPAFYYKHKILNVVQKLKEIHPVFDENQTKNDKYDESEEFNAKTKATSAAAVESEVIEKAIVKDSIKFLNFVVNLLYSSSLVVVGAFTTQPLFMMAYEYNTTGEVKLQLPFLTKYFFDPFTKITWPIIYIHHVVSTFITAFNVFGVDTLIYAFCTYAHMHFRILCHRFEHVVSNSATETKERLKALVKRHQELIHLVDQVEDVSSKSTLFNILSSSVLICLSAFNVSILDDGATIFSFFAFLSMSLSQISLLCLFGDQLMRSSTMVADGIYKCRWYDTEPDIKRSIFFILIRAQKPCRLTAANFADLNLTAFTTILSRSWSYFALLRTVYK